MSVSLLRGPLSLSHRKQVKTPTRALRCMCMPDHHAAARDNDMVMCSVRLVDADNYWCYGVAKCGRELTRISIVHKMGSLGLDDPGTVTLGSGGAEIHACSTV